MMDKQNNEIPKFTTAKPVIIYAPFNDLWS